MTLQLILTGMEDCVNLVCIQGAADAEAKIVGHFN